jgi:S-adenosylmethionine decarboxylase proenzyme
VETLGRHLIVELYGCSTSALDDPDAVEAAMLDATEAVGATRLSSSFHKFSPGGVSGTVVIAESHLSIHTWPEAGYAAVDIFTCGGLDPRPGIDVLRGRLGASDLRAQELVRGLPDEVAAAGGAVRPGQVRLVAGALGLHGLEPAPTPHQHGLELATGWFYAPHARAHTVVGLRVDRVVRDEHVGAWHLLVFDHAALGRVVVVDGVIRATSGDASLAEALTAALTGDPRAVVVVGDLDGAVTRRALRDTRAHLTVVGVDPSLRARCAADLPDPPWSHPRVRVAATPPPGPSVDAVLLTEPGDAAAWLPLLDPGGVLAHPTSAQGAVGPNDKHVPYMFDDQRWVVIRGR